MRWDIDIRQSQYRVHPADGGRQRRPESVLVRRFDTNRIGFRFDCRLPVSQRLPFLPIVLSVQLITFLN